MTLALHHVHHLIYFHDVNVRPIARPDTSMNNKYRVDMGNEVRASDVKRLIDQRPMSRLVGSRFAVAPALTADFA